MIKELEWIRDKKKRMLDEIKQYQQKQNIQIIKLVQELQKNQRKVQEVQQLWDNDKRQFKSAQTQYKEKVKELEGIANEKGRIIIKIQAQKKALEDIVQNNQMGLRQWREKDRQLRQLLRIQEKEKEKIKEQSEQQKIRNSENVERLINKYQTLIQQRISKIMKEHEGELNDVKQNNKKLFERLEQETKLENGRRQLNTKKYEEDYERIVQENKKLLSTINEYKRKILNIQTQQNNKEQEYKLTIKQKQLNQHNNLKQINCLKEDIKELEQKHKINYENSESSKWEMKQIIMKREDQLKKIKKQMQSAINQCMSSAVQEIKQLQNTNKQHTSTINSLKKEINQLKLQKQTLQQIVQYHKQNKEKLNQKNNEQQTQLSHLRNLNNEYKNQIVKKNAQIQIIKQQNKRIKAKVNRVTTAFQEHVKSREIMEQQNKMLLSEIVFLRDKKKNNKPEKQVDNSRILDMKSQKSQQFEDVQAYKELITEMQKDMTDALQKLNEKNEIIERQKAIIERLQRALKL